MSECPSLRPHHSPDTSMDQRLIADTVSSPSSTSSSPQASAQLQLASMPSYQPLPPLRYLSATPINALPGAAGLEQKVSAADEALKLPASLSPIRQLSTLDGISAQISLQPIRLPTLHHPMKNAASTNSLTPPSITTSPSSALPSPLSDGGLTFKPLHMKKASSVVDLVAKSTPVSLLKYCLSVRTLHKLSHHLSQ